LTFGHAVAVPAFASALTVDTTADEPDVDGGGARRLFKD